jgi:hypothetical protein
MIIPYEAVGFGPLISAGYLSVTWPELVLAAVSYGKSSSFHPLKYPGHSRAEKKYRTYLLYTCLRQKGQHLFKSGLYSEMDQTEKGAASYFLGMVLTKLFAERLLDTPLLWHVSTASQAVSFIPGKSRPDLIGCSSKLNDWVVAEAKGRSDGFDSAALSKAKTQSQMITTINGQVPKFRFGSESYFSPHLCVKLEDPPSEKDAGPVEFKINQAVSEYYSNFGMLKERGSKEVINGINYLTTYDEDLGVTIGLPENFTLPTSEVGLLASQSAQFNDFHSTEFEYIGRDKYFIRLDSRWMEAQMSMEPQTRGG